MKSHTTFPSAIFFLLVLGMHSSLSQVQLLDGFETLEGWEAIHSHGDASRISMKSGEGRNGKALQFDFEFIGYMGSVSIQKKFAHPLPANYTISFDIRAEDAPVNNVVVRLKDSIDNVWWINRTNYDFPRTWSKFSLKKYQVQYGWGPSLGGDIRKLDRIEIMIDVVNGGKGSVWIDNLTLEPAHEASLTTPVIVTPDSREPVHAVVSTESIERWSSSYDRDSLLIDFQELRVLGGLAIDWDQSDYAKAFDVLLSNDAQEWTTAYSVLNGSGKRNHIYLKDAECRFLKLNFKESSRRRGVGLSKISLKGPEFSFSPNEFFKSIASESPSGFYPKYFSNKQSYWTIVGVPSDMKEALINEQGMIETDKLSFSIDPFLFVDQKLVTWNDVSVSQSLEKEYLPIPSVQWNFKNELTLDITALASGREGESILYAKYQVTNKTVSSRRGRLFLALRPFQVNPPWQTFTIIGGATRIDSMSYVNGLVRVNQRYLIPLSQPDSFGVAEFDQGDVTDYIRSGAIPQNASTQDHTGFASGVLAYTFDLQPGESARFVLAIPFHQHTGDLKANLDAQSAYAKFTAAKDSTIHMWESKLNSFSIHFPASAGPVVNTIKSNIAYVLINEDGPATQPGSRSYERSWIRDGSLTSVAFLQMGIRDEVRRYLDWYSIYQFPDGAIPAVVEHSRGAEPTPEHDSHGQYIHAVKEYFAYTHDTTWLRGKWPSILRTFRHIQHLRSLRKTSEYRNGTPLQRACYGLVPESISHEGYSWQPQHSYWDDFFVVLGLKDAASIASALGEKNLAKEFSAEVVDFRKDFYNSMRAAMALKNVKYIPGCVELGDFSGLSTTIGITPCNELGFIPDSALAFTFDESYKQFLDRKNNTIKWDAYLPYDWRFVGAYVYMNQKDRALDFFEYLMKDRRPQNWNHWAEVVWKDFDAPKSIGDMPHSWAASDFIRSVRSMLVYERERDNALVVGAGIPAKWLEDPDGISVTNLPTYFGKLSYLMKKIGRRVIVDIGGDVKVAKGKLVVISPLSGTPRTVRGGVRKGNEIIVNKFPARLEISY